MIICFQIIEINWLWIAFEYFHVWFHSNIIVNETLSHCDYLTKFLIRYNKILYRF